MYHIFLIHSLVEGHLGCFQVLAMTNNAAVNIVEHMSLWHNWASFGYILKSGITGSWGRLFSNFLRNHHTDIQRGYTILHFLKSLCKAKDTVNKTKQQPREWKKIFTNPHQKEVWSPKYTKNSKNWSLKEQIIQQKKMEYRPKQRYLYRGI